MIDRQKLETVLVRRFSGATGEQIAAAANAIMGLGDEWEEISAEAERTYRFDRACICSLAREASDGAEFRVLRRRGD